MVCRKLGLLVVVMAVVGSMLLPAAAANAQTPPPVRPPLRLMTSPLPLNVVTKPGETVTADIRVKNNGTRPEQLKVELLKFGANDDTGRPQIMEREARDLYFNWVSFSETNFSAEPNVWKTIKMTIKPPKEAAFGYYFAVLFSRSSPEKPTGGRSGVEGGVASLVLLNVNAPGARREAKVAELTASQKVYEFLPAKFSVKLRNSGNVHVSPTGNIFIKRGSKQVASLVFNEQQGNILPGSNRSFEMDWKEGFPIYEEKAEGSNKSRSLNWDFNQLQNFRFGKYTATLVAVYDDGQRDVPVEAVVSFWVIPWRIIGVILLIILLVGGGLWGLSRLIWKGVRRQAAMLPDAPETDPNSLAAATKSRKKTASQQEQETATEGGDGIDAGEDAGDSKAAAAPQRPNEPAAPKERPTNDGRRGEHRGHKKRRSAPDRKPDKPQKNAATPDGSHGASDTKPRRKKQNGNGKHRRRNG
ncbi:MAG TPA: hypothetical protein VK978_03210 [Candidatus Saccharimonadales bacterium]|nr:hypothetical protein [Candidatus Saccharimonadales bacterium]